MPDRLPSLIVLVAFWIPPAVAGWVAARLLPRSADPAPTSLSWMILAPFMLGYAAAWFFFNLGRMPPYIPGAAPDPISPPPRQAVAWLAVVASALVLPGGALACWLAFRGGARMKGELGH